MRRINRFALVRFAQDDNLRLWGRVLRCAQMTTENWRLSFTLIFENESTAVPAVGPSH